MDIQLSHHNLWKDNSLPTALSWHPCQKAIDHKFKSLFLDSQFCFTDLYVYSLAVLKIICKKRVTREKNILSLLCLPMWLSLVTLYFPSCGFMLPSSVFISIWATAFSLYCRAGLLLGNSPSFNFSRNVLISSLFLRSFC